MKTFYFLCSIPAAVAFWFGAQAGAPPAPPQEPDAADPAAVEVQEVIVLDQDEARAPRAIPDHALALPRMEVRTELRSAGEPGTFTFQGPVTAAIAPVPQVPGVAGVAGVAAPAPMAFTMSSHEGANVMVVDDETRKAFDQLKKAKSDDDRDDARDALRDALNEQYDKYLARQEKELKRMAAKLKELQSQLEKRREAKDELVDLRLKTLENDASGLSWPGGEHGPDHMIWRSVAPVVPGMPAHPGGWEGPAGGNMRLLRQGVELNKLRTRVHGDDDSRTIIIERHGDSATGDDEATGDFEEVDDSADADDPKKADADEDSDDDDNASRTRTHRRK